MALIAICVFHTSQSALQLIDMRELVYSRSALKVLRRMPANVAQLIQAKLLQYAYDPISMANNVRALKGEIGVFRLRGGDWRVLFTEDGEVNAVLRIGPRSAYERGSAP